MDFTPSFSKHKHNGIFEKGPMKISNSVVSQKIDGELMILNIESGICFSLDEIAASIWELICQGYTD